MIGLYIIFDWVIGCESGRRTNELNGCCDIGSYVLDSVVGLRHGRIKIGQVVSLP